LSFGKISFILVLPSDLAFAHGLGILLLTTLFRHLLKPNRVSLIYRTACYGRVWIFLASLRIRNILAVVVMGMVLRGNMIYPIKSKLLYFKES